MSILVFSFTNSSTKGMGVQEEWGLRGGRVNFAPCACTGEPHVLDVRHPAKAIWELGARPMYASGRRPLGFGTLHQNSLRPRNGRLSWVPAFSLHKIVLDRDNDAEAPLPRLSTQAFSSVTGSKWQLSLDLTSRTVIEWEQWVSSRLVTRTSSPRQMGQSARGEFISLKGG